MDYKEISLKWRRIVRKTNGEEVSPEEDELRKELNKCFELSPVDTGRILFYLIEDNSYEKDSIIRHLTDDTKKSLKAIRNIHLEHGKSGSFIACAMYIYDGDINGLIQYAHEFLDNSCENVQRSIIRWTLAALDTSWKTFEEKKVKDQEKEFILSSMFCLLSDLVSGDIAGEYCESTIKTLNISSPISYQSIELSTQRIIKEALTKGIRNRHCFFLRKLTDIIKGLSACNDIEEELDNLFVENTDIESILNGSLFLYNYILEHKDEQNEKTVVKEWYDFIIKHIEDNAAKQWINVYYLCSMIIKDSSNGESYIRNIDINKGRLTWCMDKKLRDVIHQAFIESISSTKKYTIDLIKTLGDWNPFRENNEEIQMPKTPDKERGSKIDLSQYIKNMVHVQECSSEEIVYIYRNTSLRTVVTLWEFFNSVKTVCNRQQYQKIERLLKGKVYISRISEKYSTPDFNPVNYWNGKKKLNNNKGNSITNYKDLIKEFEGRELDYPLLQRYEIVDFTENGHVTRFDIEGMVKEAEHEEQIYSSVIKTYQLIADGESSDILKSKFPHKEHLHLSTEKWNKLFIIELKAAVSLAKRKEDTHLLIQEYPIIEMNRMRFGRKESAFSLRDITEADRKCINDIWDECSTGKISSTVLCELFFNTVLHKIIPFDSLIKAIYSLNKGIDWIKDIDEEYRIGEGRIKKIEDAEEKIIVEIEPKWRSGRSVKYISESYIRYLTSNDIGKICSFRLTDYDDSRNCCIMEDVFLEPSEVEDYNLKFITSYRKTDEQNERLKKKGIK